MRGGPRILMDMRGRVGVQAGQWGVLSEKVLREAGRRVGLTAKHELSLVLCDNPTIQRLNRRWRGKDQPTDVLSFPMHALSPGDPVPEGAVGDIVVSLATARQAATLEGLPLPSHLAFLLIHGLLHLLGYDHERPSEGRRMRNEERRLMEVGGLNG